MIGNKPLLTLAAVVILLSAAGCFNTFRLKIEQVEAWVNMMPTFDRSHNKRNGHVLVKFSVPEKHRSKIKDINVTDVTLIINGNEFPDSLLKWELMPDGQLHIFNVEFNPDDSVKVRVNYSFKGKSGSVVTPVAIVKPVY